MKGVLKYLAVLAVGLVLLTGVRFVQAEEMTNTETNTTNSEGAVGGEMAQ